MTTSGSAGGLFQALKELSMQWEQARAHWHDVKSQDFERKYIEGLPNLVVRGTKAIEELDALLRKVGADCE